MATNVSEDIYQSFNGITEEEASEFIGDNADYYIKKWKKAKPPINTAGINWAAFFLGIFWLGYRKLYSIILMYLGIFILLDLIEIFTGWPLGTSLSLAISVSIGVVANGFYYKHMVKKVTSIKKADFSEERFHEQLKKEGGTSWIGVGIALLIFGVYYGINLVLWTIAILLSGNAY